ncbi:unnamed protein product, partial [Ixodes hexagonus]
IRNVPALTQHRPWNAAPWRDEGTLAGLVKACSTLQRQSPCPAAVQTVRRHLQERLLRRLDADPRLAAIPISCGGLGLSPWDGTCTLDIPASLYLAETIALQRLSTNIASDEVPAIFPEL